MAREEMVRKPRKCLSCNELHMMFAKELKAHADVCRRMKIAGLVLSTPKVNMIVLP